MTGIPLSPFLPPTHANGSLYICLKRAHPFHCRPTLSLRRLITDFSADQPRRALEWNSDGLHAQRAFFAQDFDLREGAHQDACVVDALNGGLYFVAVVRNPPLRDVDDESMSQVHNSESAGHAYGIGVCQLPSVASQQLGQMAVEQHHADLFFDYPQHDASGSSERISAHISACLVPHPSLPLVFAFSPTKIIVIYPHSEESNASVHLHLPAAAAPSAGGIWGLTGSLKNLVGSLTKSGSRCIHMTVFQAQTAFCPCMPVCDHLSLCVISFAAPLSCLLRASMTTAIFLYLPTALCRYPVLIPKVET